MSLSKSRSPGPVAEKYAQVYLPGMLPVGGNFTWRQPEQARRLVVPVHLRQKLDNRAQLLLG